MKYICNDEEFEFVTLLEANEGGLQNLDTLKELYIKL